MSTLELTSTSKSFGGTVSFYKHQSETCHSAMNFSVFLPPQAIEDKSGKYPVLFWLSGLTCSEENFMAKSAAQKYAAELGLIIIAPDTSPRGLGLAGETDSWDFGVGAGFYVDATEAPWQKNFNMESYIAHELYDLVAENFPVDINRAGIFGHSMGGHGAITLAFNYPEKYKSLSAFAPICAPTQCAWGNKAFSGYLGEEKSTWEKYDAHLLISKTTCTLPLLIDQGGADNFLADQLLPEKLIEEAEKINYPLTYRLQEGYDHSYYFISSFMEEHLQHHAKALLL